MTKPTTTTTPSKVRQPTLGQRNNNPLNIRNNSAKPIWKGQKPDGNTPFVHFAEKKWGYRAAFILLYNYINAHKCDTIRRIISRWAPPEDFNETERYIRYVSEQTGIHPDTELKFTDGCSMVNIVEAMAQMESASFHEKEVIVDAYLEACKDRNVKSSLTLQDA